MDNWDLSEIIDLLVSNPRKRTNSFVFERELRLFQFQTWIYFPTRPDIVQMAGRIVATLCLRCMEAGVPYGRIKPIRQRSYLSHQYEELFNTDDYRGLFDAVIGEYGGWTRLLDTLTPRGFDEEMRKRIASAETVSKMIDYRLRYLDHDGSDLNQANIRHSEFYRHKDPAEKISWKTIRQRWKANKESAVFLYVSENFDFAPLSIRSMGFLDQLPEQAADTKRIRRFFGYAAYVFDQFEKRESH